jgi:myo-inositol-1(or 4)-monophosphatase
MNDRAQFALGLAREAGQILMQGYDKGKSVGYKGVIDPVTEYDLRSERYIATRLAGAYPEDGILAEEGGQLEQGAAQWLVDPLDGTVNYAHGLPIFSVSIAYVVGEKPQLGVVYDPAKDEMFHALRDGGAWLNGEPIQVSETSTLDESLLVTGFPYDLRTHPENNLNHFNAFALQVQGLRRLGSAALDLAYVACGRLEGYWELRLAPWDWAAGMLLVAEAGGQVTRVDGTYEVFADPPSMVASNGHIHQAMLRVLNRD